MINRSYLVHLIFVLSTFTFLSSGIYSVNAGEKNAGIDSLITGAIQGKVTGLPIPRFVSLKSRRTNMRVGPSVDHRISWVYVKPNIPVEVVQEFEVWRLVRDSDGQEGWVHKALLSSRRMAIVAPWSQGDFFTLYKKPTETAPKTAKLQAGVYADILTCRDDWCQIGGKNYRGWLKSSALWGVYPNEAVK